MKIGNNIHTTSNKKAYRKPVLEVVEIDRVISLQFPSPEDPSGPGGPIPGDTGTISGVSSFPNNTLPAESDYVKENPFGGGTPNYQR